MKLLTVTVPCFNSQEYMNACIDSLLKGGNRVEIIIIDDGSTDHTGEIADGYAAQYPHIIKVVHQANGGHGEGINQGLDAASGIYFKVVDSDDTVSSDFPAFLDALDRYEAEGGVDLFVTNYYYVHADGKGDRSICYKNVLPEGRIFSWKDTKKFRIHQLLTVHSCTFRTEVMRRAGKPLPKHIFYEDNLMVYQTLSQVRRMAYQNINLYRYWIGRPDQSVQKKVMMHRYRHQLLVTERCFRAVHLGDVLDPHLQRYLKHELFMMFGISILFTRLNKTDAADSDLMQMWKNCEKFDPAWAKHFRSHTALAFLLIPGRAGRIFVAFIYRLANRVVRFN